MRARGIGDMFGVTGSTHNSHYFQAIGRDQVLRMLPEVLYFWSF